MIQLKKQQSFCIFELVNKSPDNTKVISDSGGAPNLVDYITNVKGDSRLNYILALVLIKVY